MPAPPARSPSPPANAERLPQRLVTLRWLSVATMLATAWPLAAWLGLRLPVDALLAVALTLAGANFLVLGALARGAAADSPRALFAQLLLDVLAWSAFVYFSGGATNPLISLLLPLVAIGAAVQPAAQAWALASLAVAAYALLWQHYRPIQLDHAETGSQLHLAGMWLTFLLSAAVITGFVARMTTMLRARDRALARAAEEMARAEHVVALGNLAAGAAHSLGTPLGTIRLVAGELLATPQLPATLRDDVQLVVDQVEHCRRTLSELSAQAGELRAEGGGAVSAKSWLENSLARWQEQRPHARLTLAGSDNLAGVRIVADTTLAQALQTLVNNAADVSPLDIQVTAQLDAGALLIDIGDRGPGVPDALRHLAGSAPWSKRPNGMGIGLFLAINTLRRHGGELVYSARPGGGTLARLHVPLEQATA